MKNNKVHFRVDTPALLKEIVGGALREHCGVLQVPIKTFVNFLGQISDRCAEINDPVLNRIMFDLNLYDLPKPSNPEYQKIMKQLYSEEEEYLKSK